MNPFEYMQALAQMWNRGGQGFAAAQPETFSDMAKAVAKPWDQASGQPAGPPGEGAPASFFDPQGLAGAKQAFDRLWSSAIGISQTIARNVERGEKVDPAVTELLGKLFDPRAWFSSIGGMDEALQRMAEGPRLADLWDSERKLLDLFNAWTALRRRSIEHNTLMLEAWMQAAAAFAKTFNDKTFNDKTLNDKADRKETLESWREALALWVETANTTMLETQRSEKYLASQREVLTASTDLRLAQQEMAAFYSEVLGYPSRAELDDVHRTVTELRRELRALQRAGRPAVAVQLPASDAGTAPAPPAPGQGGR